MRVTLVTAAAMATLAQSRDLGPEQSPAKAPVPGLTTSQGCFSAKAGEKADIKASSVSSGACTQACRKDFTVAITSGQGCYCANEYPPKDALVDDDNCDYGCPGYALEACGGLPSDDAEDGYFSVWNLGVKLNIPNAKGGNNAGGDEDDPEDVSEGRDGSREDNGKNEGDDEHHSPTSLWTASQTTSGTATVTTTPSATPTGDDSGNNDSSESSSATASSSPAESDPPEGAAAGLGLSMAAVAGGALAIVAAVF